MTRPPCAFCKDHPVKQARTRYCSTRCAGMAKRVSRRPCAQCRKALVRRWSRSFCSRRCAVKARGAAGVAQLRREKVKAAQAQRAKYFERVKAFIAFEIEPVVALVSEAERHALRLALMKAGVETYRRGYKRGYTCAANRFRHRRAA